MFVVDVLQELLVDFGCQIGLLFYLFIFFYFFFYRAKLDSLNAKDLSRSVFLKKIKFWGRFFLGFGIWN